MAYEIGTATNYKNLLERLQDFLNNPARAIGSGDTSISELSPMGSGEFWTIRRWDTDYDGDNGYEMILEGPGSSGDDQIFVGIQTYYHAGDDYFNWRLQGYTGYSAAADFNSQPGAMTDAPTTNPKVLLWNSSIPYWFIGNGRRFAVIAKISTVYECLYMGFLLPYGLPNQIPYPLVIGGSSPGNASDAVRWSGLAPEHRNYYDACDDVGSFSPCRVLHGGTWLECYNWGNSETNEVHSDLNTWPYSHGSVVGTGYDENWLWMLIKNNLDNSYPLFPVIVHGESPEINIYGELQGIYALPGQSLAAEDTITVNGDTYVVTQNVHRTDTHVYMAMKKE